MKVKITKKKELNTYSEVWHVSYYTLEQAKKESEGSYFQIISSLIFTAFTLEAYLNHIGKKLFSCWDELERSLSPQQKMNLITEKSKIVINYSKRPFQTAKQLLKFRNDVAHGKSVILKSENILFTSDLDFLNKKLPLEDEWQKYCSLDNAERAREDIENIMRQIHTASKIKEPLFFAGLSSTITTLSKE